MSPPADLRADSDALLDRDLAPLLRGGPLDPERSLAVVRAMAEGLAIAGDRHDADPPPSARPEHASPEQIRDEPLTPSSHVYSLAAILFHCLAGEPPFARSRRFARAYWHMRADRPRVTEIRPELSSALDQVIRRGMAIDPEDRPPGPRAFVAEAEAALESAPEPTPGPVQRPAPRSAPAPPGSVFEPSKRPRRAVVDIDWSGPADEPITSRPRLRAAAAVVIAAAVVAAGYGAARSGDAPERPAFERISAPGLAVTVPSDWRPARPAAIPGFEPGRALAVRPRHGDGVLAAGFMGRGSRGAPTLPDAIRSALAAPPKPGERVRLAELDAVRYRLQVSGIAGTVTLYTVPTTLGTAGLACAEGATLSFARDCERRASTLELTGPRALPISTSDPYASRIKLVLGKLERTRAPALAAMKRARTRARQATAAARLGDAYGTAARRLRTVPAPPPTNARITATLAASARAYAAIARAGARGDKPGYAKARRAAISAERAVRAAVARLRRAG